MAFVVCPECGRHGHFLFPDGRESMEYLSKQEAFLGLETLCVQGNTTSFAQSFLVEQVVNSSLPSEIVRGLVEQDVSYLAWSRVKGIFFGLMQQKRQVWPSQPPCFFEGLEDYCRLAEILTPFSLEGQEVSTYH